MKTMILKSLLLVTMLTATTAMFGNANNPRNINPRVAPMEMRHDRATRGFDRRHDVHREMLRHDRHCLQEMRYRHHDPRCRCACHHTRRRVAPLPPRPMTGHPAPAIRGNRF